MCDIFKKYLTLMKMEVNLYQQIRFWKHTPIYLYTFPGLFFCIRTKNLIFICGIIHNGVHIVKRLQL